MMNKVKVKKEEIIGHDIYGLVMEVSFILESLSGYEIASNYNRRVLNAKNNIERLKIISSYIEIM